MARAVAALALALLAPGTVRANTPSLPASERPAITRDVSFDQRLGVTLPLDARFVEADGTPVRLGDLVGKRPVVLVPAYYHCPMLCTLVLNGVVRMARALSFDVGTAFDVVVFSFDPNETPALAATKKASLVSEYRRPGTEHGWHVLTGPPESITALTQAIGFHYAYDATRKQFAHATGLVVVTPDGRTSRYFFGVEFSPRDVRLAVVDASAGHVGSVVDQLLLLCLQWDPTRGRYTTSVMKVLRAGGILTLLAFGAFVWQTHRRRAGHGGTA
jgi:protein SCO1/2